MKGILCSIIALIFALTGESNLSCLFIVLAMMFVNIDSNNVNNKINKN